MIHLCSTFLVFSIVAVLDPWPAVADPMWIINSENKTLVKTEAIAMYSYSACKPQDLIPISLAKKMCTLNTTQQIQHAILTYGSNEVNQPRFSNLDTHLDVCRPTLQVIPLPRESPNVQYHPKYLRVERCGGCTFHRNLECRSKKMQNVTVPVRMLVFERLNKVKSSETVTVVVSKHEKCTCTQI